MISIPVYMVYISNDTMQSTFIFWCTIQQTLPKDHPLRWWSWLSLQNWTWAFTLLLLLKLILGKLLLDCFYEVSFPEVAKYYKSTIWLCIQSCYHIWAGAPSCYLEFMVKLQKRICRSVIFHVLPLWNPWLIILSYSA